MSNSPLQDDPFLLQLLDASVDGVVAFDRDCRFIAWNSAMERITGLGRGTVLGKSAFDVFPFLKETGEDKCLYAALAGEHSTSENQPYTVPETSRVGFFKGYYSPLHDQHNEIIGGIAVMHDITAGKLAAESAQEAHQRLTFHVENSPLASIEWDSEFRVSRWSESAERLFGWRAHEVLGKHVNDWHFVFDEDIDAVEEVADRQRVGVELLGVQHNRNYTKDGLVVYCEWYNSVLHDESGKLVSVLSLVLDVTARKLAEEERAALLARERDLRKQAEGADRLKDEFLATLSHELRTPLTSILGWAIMLRNGDVDREESLDSALEVIERNARSQSRLIDDLLDVSRIITGNLQLDVHLLNVAPLVEKAIEALRPAAAAKGIHVEPKLDPENCLVSGDPNRLRQVIWNLLMNAIKFTRRGGKVSLGLECVETATRLTVSDTGDGISAEFLPYVFHRFRQEEGSMSRKAGGLGLGLAVVRHLVELHGGSVSAKSDGPGRGSTFTVELPLVVERRHTDEDAGSAEMADRQMAHVRRRGDQAQARDGVRNSPGASIDGGRGSGLFETGEFEGGPANSTKLAGVRVLLVEDDDDSRNLLSMILERHGAEVISVASSSDALDAFVQESPDLVISDIGMAEEDGYELIRKLRSLPVQGSLLTRSLSLQPDPSPNTHNSSLVPDHHPSIPPLIPAIALTGYATKRDRDRALSAGYQLHLAKPIEPAELVTAILTLLGQVAQS